MHACMQNGLPFHHGHLTCHPALAGKPLPAVDPSGELFSTFARHQVVSGVAYIAAARSAVAEVTVRSMQKNIRFLFGAVDDSGGPNACRSAALEEVVAALSRANVNSCIVCIYPHSYLLS